MPWWRSLSFAISLAIILLTAMDWDRNGFRWRAIGWLAVSLAILLSGGN